MKQVTKKKEDCLAWLSIWRRDSAEHDPPKVGEAVGSVQFGSVHEFGSASHRRSQFFNLA